MRPSTACFWILAVTLFITCPGLASGQYYYKDILGTRESGAKQEAYKENKVRKVVVRSYAPNGDMDTDFVCDQSVNADYTRMETNTNAPSTGNSQLISYYDASSKLIRSVDSNASASTTIAYTYDGSANLLSVTSLSNATNPDSGSTRSKEEHLWQYNASGQPTGMLKIKEGKDTTQVRLQLDAQGNVTDEISSRVGSQLEHYYYYYDEAHHLTDIVRYNRMLQRMLPDYMFEYDESGHLVQMTVVQAISTNYVIWRYVYGNNGLRSKEICYDKSKQPIGSIGYSYEP